MTAYVRSKMPAYGRVPKPLIYDARVTDSAVRVYAALDDIGPGREYIPLKLIARRMGKSYSTIQRAITTLETTGWVEVIDRVDPVTGADLAKGYVLNVEPPGQI